MGKSSTVQQLLLEILLSVSVAVEYVVAEYEPSGLEYLQVNSEQCGITRRSDMAPSKSSGAIMCFYRNQRKILVSRDKEEPCVQFMDKTIKQVFLHYILLTQNFYSSISSRFMFYTAFQVHKYILKHIRSKHIF